MSELIDVASYQGRPDWNAVRNAAVNGMYEKLTEGTGYVNPYWTDNWNGAGSAGLPRGAYHFADLGDPVAEANHFADVYLSVPRWELVPVLDDEKNGATGQWVQRFRQQFRNRTGRAWFRVYSGQALLAGSLNPDGWFDAQTSIWAARYAAGLGWDHAGLELWQNSSSANIPGVLGHVDTDQGLHGWTVATDLARMGITAPLPPPPPNPAPLPHPITGKLPPNTYLKEGDRGPAVLTLQLALLRQYPAYENNLIGAADGIFGPKTKAGVMEFQRRDRLAVDGIAGPRTLGALYLI